MRFHVPLLVPCKPFQSISSGKSKAVRGTGLLPMARRLTVEGNGGGFAGSSDLGYDPLGTPPQGEVCIRGPAIFSGYYKDPEKTEQAFGTNFFPAQSLSVTFSSGEIVSSWPPHPCSCRDANLSELTLFPILSVPSFPYAFRPHLIRNFSGLTSSVTFPAENLSLSFPASPHT